MAYIKDGSRVTRHVSFTPKEDSALRKRAEKVGMAVVPFIKREALHGAVKGFALAPLTRHAEAIGEIVRDVKTMASRPHPDRHLYEADLDGINDKLDELLEIEKSIHELLRRRMK